MSITKPNSQSQAKKLSNSVCAINERTPFGCNQEGICKKETVDKEIEQLGSKVFNSEVFRARVKNIKLGYFNPHLIELPMWTLLI